MKRIIFILAATVLMGQSCTISLGQPKVIDGGVYRTDDRGLNWVQKTFVSQAKKKTIQINNLDVVNLTFNPENSRNIFIGTKINGIWYSDNAGDQWTQTSLKTGEYRCISFDVGDPDTIYTASGLSVLKSTDHGLTWQVVYNESQPNNLVNCVIVDPVKPNEIWATTSGGKIIFSENYGQSWTLKNTLTAFTPRRLYIPPDGSGQLYVFTENQGIYKLTDYGANSEDLSVALREFPGATDIRDITIVGYPDSRWYLGSAYGLLLSSQDEGASWQVIKSLVNPQSIPILNVVVNYRKPEEIYLTIGQKLHYSSDYGATWTVRDIPTTRILTQLTIDPSNTKRLYITTIKPEKK